MELLRQLLKEYRVVADYLYSDVKNKIRTQKEYEKALTELENKIIKQIYKKFLNLSSDKPCCDGNAVFGEYNHTIECQNERKTKKVA